MDCKINRTPNGLVQYPIHKHKNYEIMLYLTGQGYMRTSTGDIPFRQGTIIIVPPNLSHGTISQSGFQNISVEGNFEKYLHCDTAISFSDNETQEGTTLARLIYDNRYGNAAYLHSLCTAYICFLMQQFEIENEINKSVKKIMMTISECAFDPEIDLTSILRESGYSEDYIRSYFKKLTEKTPNEFLTEVRIGHACFMIDIYKRNLSLTEIAEQCGYSDYSYFSKKFKSIMGISPQAYRNQ